MSNKNPKIEGWTDMNEESSLQEQETIDKDA